MEVPVVLLFVTAAICGLIGLGIGYALGIVHHASIIRFDIKGKDEVE